MTTAVLINEMTNSIVCPFGISRCHSLEKLRQINSSNDEIDYLQLNEKQTLLISMIDDIELTF